VNATYKLRQDGKPVQFLDTDARATFITRTYAHLFGAIVAFTVLEIFIFRAGLAQGLTSTLAGSQLGWLVVLGGFVLIGSLASRVAMTARSLGAQYAALGAYVVIEALIFVPILFIATLYAPGVIESAALVTLLGFTGLTLVAVQTRKDFSFLRSVVGFAGVMAIVLIVASFLFGFQLGTWFSVGMVALAGASILYQTSDILKRYPEDRYVGAALGLFAAVALMFWYVLRLFMVARD
jgi:FtsH-binding integral membrane protein